MLLIITDQLCFFFLYNVGDEPCANAGVCQSGDAEEAIFVELIQTVLNDPAEREHFCEARQLV